MQNKFVTVVSMMGSR